MGSKYGEYGSKSGASMKSGNSGKSSGSQLGCYGSKEGGGKYTSPGKSRKTMKGPGY